MKTDRLLVAAVFAEELIQRGGAENAENGRGELRIDGAFVTAIGRFVKNLGRVGLGVAQNGGGREIGDEYMKTDRLLVAAVFAMVAVWAEEQAVVPYPSEFRSWQHVKSIVIGADHPSFARRGGIHHYYANEKAMEGYRTGKFPNGSVIVDEGVFAKDGEGQGKGILLEGERRGLDVMVKDDRLYKETGGWGFEHFDGDGRKGMLPASGRAQCYGCHSKTERDHVFSAVRR